MNLPHQWNLLNLGPEESERFLFGADYSNTSFKYSIYITDLSHVWISDVDQEKLEFKAIQNGIQRDSVGNVYQMLIKAFETNFHQLSKDGEDEDGEISLKLEKFKVDRGIPLELKLSLSKTFNSNNFKWNWSFDLSILPDSSSITILRNVIFQMSTVIASLNEYKNDLVKQIHNKDTAIRFLTESVENLNASHMVEKWAPENSSNYAILQKFDKNYFDTVWKNLKLKQLQNKFVWDTIRNINESNIWAYGTSFKSEEDPDKSKKTLKAKSPEEMRQSSFLESTKPEVSSNKENPNLDNLNNDFEDYDINEQEEEEKEMARAKAKTEKAHSAKSTPTPSDSSSGSKSPEKKKKSFGVSRKRKVQYKEFSPIKAPKLFQNDD